MDGCGTVTSWESSAATSENELTFFNCREELSWL